MLDKIKGYFLKRKVLKQYYEEKAQKVMEKYVKENNDCVAIRDENGKIKRIRGFKLIKK